MDRPLKTIRNQAFSAAAAAAVAAATLAFPIGDGVAAQEDDITIGVAMHTQMQRRWGFDAKMMEAEAEKQGVELIFQWAGEDPATQASQVENLLSQGIDALIIVPADSQAAGRIVQSAQASEVPVIAYDIGITTAAVDFSVIRNNKDVGVIQAKAALEHAPEGNWAIFKGDPGSDVAQIVAEGYAETLDGASVNIVFEQFIRDWDTQRALSNAENVLSAQDDKVDVFLVTNDGMATGVARALTARNLAGKVFLSGLDADPSNLQLIRDGVQTLSVWTDLRAQGAAAVQAAVALAKGEAPDLPVEQIDAGAGPVPTHLVEVMAIDRDNLCQFITEISPGGGVEMKDIFDDPAACGS